jgi:hypothetical protein
MSGRAPQDEPSVAQKTARRIWQDSGNYPFRVSSVNAYIYVVNEYASAYIDGGDYGQALKGHK